MNPLGKEYDAVKDLEAYKNFLNKMRVFTYLKIIGIGKGATFVIKLFLVIISIICLIPFTFQFQS